MCYHRERVFSFHSLHAWSLAHPYLFLSPFYTSCVHKKIYNPDLPRPFDPFVKVATPNKETIQKTKHQFVTHLIDLIKFFLFVSTTDLLQLQKLICPFRCIIHSLTFLYSNSLHKIALLSTEYLLAKVAILTGILIS